jgi:DNA-directed RNA polymerase subunit RPC12/RpoP
VLRPDLLLELHPVRNGDIDPARVSVWAKRKVWWVCSTCGHEWESMIMNRQQGTGCPTCAERLRRETFRTNAAQRV